MRTSLLLVPALALSGVVAVPASAAPCRHLLVDPAGDADRFGNHGVYPSPVDDPSPSDIRWAELRTTRTSLVATVKVQDLDPEGGSTLDHAWSVTFDTGGRSLELIHMHGQYGDWAYAQESVAGDDRPEDGGAYVGRTIGTIEAVRDPKRDVVVLTAPLSLVGPLDPVLTRVSATGWAGVALLKGGTYAVADTSSTTRGYRVGAPDCLT